MTALTVSFCNSSQDMGAVYVARIHMTKMTRKQMLCMRPWINVWMRNERKGERKNCKNKSKNTVKNDQKFSSSFQTLRYICFLDSLRQRCTFKLVYLTLRGVLGRVVSLDLKSFATLRCWFKSCEELWIFHVRKLSSQLTERQWFYSWVHLCLKSCTEWYLRSSSTIKAVLWPYNLNSINAISICICIFILVSQNLKRVKKIHIFIY